MSSPLLLVEGNQDRDFFVASLRRLGFPDIEVKPPKEAARPGSTMPGGWTGILAQLPVVLDRMKEADGPEGLGIVIDADFPENAGGFSIRRAAIEKMLNDNGYASGAGGLDRGEIFTHWNGLPQVGLWVMPDHSSNGMLEDFLVRTVTGAEHAELLEHGRRALATLPHVLFNLDFHHSKALVFTWRAWQKKPGCPLAECLKTGALDETQHLYKDFINWIKATYERS